MKTTRKYILLLILTLAPHFLYAGGWVANGIGGQTTSFSYDKSGSDEKNRKAKNFFLLNPKEAALTLAVAFVPETVTTTQNGLTSKTTDVKTYAAPLFSYGFTKNLSLWNYFTLMYGLYEDARHDMAISTGLMNFGFKESIGYFLKPNLRISHSYLLTDWLRFVQHLSTQVTYKTRRDLDGEKLHFDQFAHQMSFISYFGNWSLSLGARSYAGYKTSQISNRESKKWKSALLVAEPEMGVARKLGPSSELGFSIQLPYLSSSSANGPTSLLYMQTRF